MELGSCHFSRGNSSCLAVSPNMIEYGMESSYHLRDEDSNIVGPDCALSLNDGIPEFSQPLLVSNHTAISPSLPPSFMDFLTHCSDKGQEGKPKPASADLSCGNELSLLSYLANASAPEVIDALLKPSYPDFTINSELMKYASNASFHDMLDKIEAIITDLGGDMSL